MAVVAVLAQGCGEKIPDPLQLGHWECDSSPCRWTKNGVTMELRAERLSSIGTTDTWHAEAIDESTGLAIAALDVQASYGPQQSTLSFTCQRDNSPFGLRPLAPTTDRSVEETIYGPGGEMIVIDVSAMTFFLAYLVGDSSLGLETASRGPGTANPMSAECKRRAKADEFDGCSGPWCPDYVEPCCWIHDHCYCNGGHAQGQDLDPNEILQEISDHLPADSDYKGKQFPASNSYNKISGSNAMQGRTAPANLNTEQARRDCDNGFRACLEKVGLRETWPRLLAIKYLSVRKCGASGFDFGPAAEGGAEVEDEEEGD